MESKSNATQALVAQTEKSLQQLVRQYERNIVSALPTHIKPERILSVIRTAITSNVGLKDCSPMSVIAGIVAASRLGLELDPALGHAYLVPRWNKNTRMMEASFQIGYQGMLELSQRAEKGIIIRVRHVCQNDKFRMVFDPEPQISHEIDITQERGPVIASYTYVKYADGRVDVFEPMPISEALKIRDQYAPHERCKECWNKRGVRDNCQACGGTGQSDEITGPWATNESEMVRKTCLRRNWKWLPKSAEMLDAQRIEGRQDAGESPQSILLDIPADEGAAGSQKAADDVAERMIVAEMRAAERKIAEIRASKPSTSAPDAPSDAPSDQGAPPPPKSQVVEYDSWEAWERAGNPIHPLIVVKSGEGAGAFAWHEADSSYKASAPPKPAPVTEEQSAPKRERPQFGRPK